MAETTLSKAFAKAGVTKEDAQLFAAISNYLKSGGTVDRAYDLVDEAAWRLSGTGLSCEAKNGHPTPASARQPNGDIKGQPIGAGEKGQGTDALMSPSDAGRTLRSVRTEREQAGAGTLLPKGPRSVAPPARVPSKVELDAEQRTAVRAARSIFDRSIGGSLTLRNATKRDLVTLARKFDIGKHQLNRFVTEFAWPDDDKTTLPEVATEKQVAAIYESGSQALRALEGM